MSTWFYSDSHFSHEAIIYYCNRPFKNAAEMDETLIRNYNKLVQDNDTVFFLGDTGFNKAGSLANIIKRLKGKKILILGNHCNSGRNTYLNMGFSAVLDNAMITIGKDKVSLAHHPERSLSEMLRLFWIYARKMFTKGRSPLMIYQRLKAEWKNQMPFKSKYHLHGHIHNTHLKKGKNINCCVEMWDYKPIHLKEIVSLIERTKDRHFIKSRKDIE